MPYPISRQQQCSQPRRQGKVRNGRNIIVGEVDGILGPSNTEILYSGDFVACGLKKGVRMSMMLIV
jgi:hypothetical protein